MTGDLSPGDGPAIRGAQPPRHPVHEIFCPPDDALGGRLGHPAGRVTLEMLMQRCDTPLLLAAAGRAADLAEARGWSAATLTGVFYGLKAMLDGRTGDGPVLLSEVCQRVRPRRHSSATRIAEVLARMGLLPDDTAAAIRAWIDRRTCDLPAGFRRDIRAWLMVLLDGDARTRPRSPTTIRDM